MKIRFHRSRSFEVILPTPSGSGRRGFFFRLGLGVEAPVDPLSGMTVNLSVVDGWLDDLGWPREARGVWSLVDDFWRPLAAKAMTSGATLTRLEIRGDDSWWATDGKLHERGFLFPSFRPREGMLRPCRREFILTSTLPMPRDPAPDEFRNLREGDIEILLASGWPAIPDWNWKEIRDADPAGDLFKTYRP